MKKMKKFKIKKKPKAPLDSAPGLLGEEVYKVLYEVYHFLYEQSQKDLRKALRKNKK
jgi:hypothetical protein